MTYEQPPQQTQSMPGSDQEMTPAPDYGYESYQGHGRLAGKRAVITGGDSGIGKAVALAFAREGADVLISYLSEEEDAKEVAGWIEEAGRKVVLVPGDITDPAHCRTMVDTAVSELGGIDVLVNNAAFQMTRTSIEEISDEEWDKTFATNIGAMFRITKAALDHMGEGSSIINTTSVNYDQPLPQLMAYAATKAAIANFTASLSQMLGARGIRANAVAPGPVWTPLIPGSMSPETVESFGSETPLGRAAQPVELAPAYVLLASDEASAMSGSIVPVTMGKPLL